MNEFVEMTLNPYQGLKRITDLYNDGDRYAKKVEITLNPYQGLKVSLKRRSLYLPLFS
jgi:hypothetical protein